MNSPIDSRSRSISAAPALPLPQPPGLSHLLAEMTGLAAVIPGLVPVRLPDEAEVEAAFDNMPV